MDGESGSALTKCAHRGCSRPPLWYTDPPTCRRHMGSLDEWFAQVKRRSGKRYSPGVRHQMYLYESVRRGPGRIFFREYEDRAKHERGPGQAASRGAVERGGRVVAFHLSDIVFFCAAAAASGVIGNFAYDALKAFLARIRAPRRELIGGTVSFESIVEKRTYNRIRRELHGGKRPVTSNEEIERSIETKYELMVTMTPSLDYSLILVAKEERML